MSFLIIDKHPMELISRAVYTMTNLLDQNKTYDIEIKEHKERRSLDANAYFHVLVNKLAEALHISLDVIKKQMVCDYSTGIPIRMPNGWTPEMYGIRYVLNIGASKGTKEPCTDYLVFKPTHEMNSSEMARLIEGTREECINAGIPEEELLTPNEIANLRGIRE